MISPFTGEVVFADGLRFRPHELLTEAHLFGATYHAALPVPGWTQHGLGAHPSEYGDFKVEVVADWDFRTQAVLVARRSSFYESDTADDAERHEFHERIIGADLLGQEEYSWGETFCRLDPTTNKDWLIVLYATGPQVPLRAPDVLRRLYEVERTPERSNLHARWHVEPDAHPHEREM